jgi:hypothetical protein
MAIVVASCTTPTKEVVSPIDAPNSSTTAGLAETDDIKPPELEKSYQRVALDRVVAWMNGAPLLEVDYPANFSSVFTNQLSYENLRDLFGSLAAGGPWRVEELRSESAFGLEADVVRDEGESLVVSLGVNSEQPDQIALLFFQPESIAMFEPSADAAEAERRLSEAGALRFVTADVTSGECVADSGDRVDEPGPIGSAFSLYVLAAVVDSVANGTIAWADEIVVSDALDSLPAGTTQNEPDGSALTVLELAERMIQISDNTASDHLVALVGRTAVEDAMSSYGHSDPQLNIPFLTTREAFILKLAFSEDDRAAFIAADADGRRTYLDEIVADADLPQLSVAANWAEPIDINEIEWFASPNDLCRALVELSNDDVAKDVLVDPTYVGPWDYVGAKGGSEPGVLALAWLVEPDDERAEVVVVMVADSRQDLLADTHLLLLELRDFALAE